MKLPKSDRRFSDLIPWPRRLFSGVRRFFLRTAVTGVGALMVGPGVPLEGPRPDMPTPPVAVTLVNREKKSSIGKLILSLRSGSGWSMLAGHRSHSSHSSHRSHSSHSSHYSSSRGTAPSAPAPYIPPSPAPSPAPAPVKPSAPHGIISTPEASPAEQVIIEITRMDLEHSWIAGKDKAGKELVFYFGALTKIRRLTPYESTRTVTEVGLPLATEQEVLVAWRFDPEKKRRIAIQFTVY